MKILFILMKLKSMIMILAVTIKMITIMNSDFVFQSLPVTAVLIMIFLISV